MQLNWAVLRFISRKHFCTCLPLNWAFFGFETPGSVFCLFAGNHANFSFLSLKTFFLLFGIELAVLTFIASKIGFFCFFTDDHLVLSNVKGFSARLQLITLIVAISQWKQCILSFLAKLRCWQRYHVHWKRFSACLAKTKEFWALWHQLVWPSSHLHKTFLFLWPNYLVFSIIEVKMVIRLFAAVTLLLAFSH